MKEKNKESGSGIILASTSQIRQKLLAQAGLRFASARPHVDEAALTAQNKTVTAQHLSLMLARAKALSIKAPEKAWIIGCDQVLEFEGRVYAKAKTMQEAARRLARFAGKTHHLVGGCALAQDGKIIWEHQSRATLQMRPMDDALIRSYLKRAGPGILASVGCYEIEGLGITLMEHMHGDYFSILGLPLLPLLVALRQRGALP